MAKKIILEINIEGDYSFSKSFRSNKNSIKYLRKLIFCFAEANYLFFKNELKLKCNITHG